MTQKAQSKAQELKSNPHAMKSQKEAGLPRSPGPWLFSSALGLLPEAGSSMAKRQCLTHYCDVSGTQGKQREGTFFLCQETQASCREQA